MIEQILRRYHNRQVLNGTRPDQGAPRAPHSVLVDAGRHENELGAAQRQGPRHFRHVNFAAHRKADLAVCGVKDRKFVAGNILKFPRAAAGINPGPIRMRAPIPRRRPPVGISHDDQVVSGCRFDIERLDRAEHGMDAMLGSRLGKRRTRIERRGHAPRPGIGLREADEIRPIGRSPFDPLHRIGNIALGFAGRVRNRLHDGDTEGH